MFLRARSSGVVGMEGQIIARVDGHLNRIRCSLRGFMCLAFLSRGPQRRGDGQRRENNRGSVRSNPIAISSKLTSDTLR